jgi:hypothetical protein
MQLDRFGLHGAIGISVRSVGFEWSTSFSLFLCLLSAFEIEADSLAQARSWCTNEWVSLDLAAVSM